MEVLISTLKVMVPFIKDWGALITAGISLLVAIISLFKSSKAQRLQNKKVAHLVRQHSVAKRLGQKNRKNNRIKNSQPCKHLCKAGCF